MPRTKLYHLTAKQRDADDSLLLPERATWMWAALERQFPRALGVHLMRDHVHIVTPVADMRATRQALGRILANYVRVFGFESRYWRRSPDPIPIRNQLMLERAVRYVALNRNREHTALDPIEPVWSTHRDVIGATARAWVDAPRLRHALGWRPADFLARYHHYVSRDTSVSIDGTPLPVPVGPRADRQFDFTTIAGAAASAYRSLPRAARAPGPVRDLFIALALDQGHDRIDRLADVLSVSRWTVRRRANVGVDQRALHASRMCLSDPRLRGP